MEVVCTEKKIILFFIYSHEKFLALSLLNPLRKNPGVTIGKGSYATWEAKDKGLCNGGGNRSERRRNRDNHFVCIPIVNLSNSCKFAWTQEFLSRKPYFRVAVENFEHL